jgi:hypothetical protein
MKIKRHNSLNGAVDSEMKAIKESFFANGPPRRGAHLRLDDELVVGGHGRVELGLQLVHVLVLRREFRLEARTSSDEFGVPGNSAIFNTFRFLILSA